jgi:hypothetical protein
MTGLGHEAKSLGLYALSARKSIPDVTAAPLGAHRIPQGAESRGNLRVGRDDSTVLRETG